MIYLAIFAFGVYLYYAILFHRELNSRKIALRIKKEPHVSVLIAARNEEKTIAKILTALSNQTYPTEKYEVFVANDASLDNTEKILKTFSEKFENINYFNVKNRASAVSPKKNALTQCIQKTSGSILLTTDADCLVKTTWIESMVSYFDEETDMVAGFSRTHISNWKAASFLQKFEHFDFLFLMTALAGSILANKNFACSGQNLAYKKKAFLEVGGFSKIAHLLSGDDTNLMQLFRKHNKHIRFNFNPNSFAFTEPIQSWTALFNQRNRWASNITFQIHLNKELFFYLMNVFIVMLSVVYFIIRDARVAFLLVGVKMLTDGIYFYKNCEKFNVEPNRKNFYFLWFFIQPFFNLIVATLGMLKIFRWEVKR